MNILNKIIVSQLIDQERRLHANQCSAIGTVYGLEQARVEHFKDEMYYKRISDFIALLDNKAVSANPFNGSHARSVLMKSGIIKEHKWGSFSDFIKMAGDVSLSAGRAHVLGQYSFIYRHLVLILVSGGPCKHPLILDREFRIIDGLQRLLAIKMIPGCDFYAIRLDYEAPEDKWIR